MPRRIIILLLAVGNVSAELTDAYEVKYGQVQSNCNPSVSDAPSGTVRIKRTNSQIVVEIDRLPAMTGTLTKDSKLTAKSKLNPALSAGVQSVFSAAGRVDQKGGLSLVLVGQFQANDRPLCTKSWQANGRRRTTPLVKAK